jgi:serine/threonine protein phosphatase PrpC
MNCPYCTAVLPEDDLFCEECGERLPTAAAASQEASCACGAGPEEIDDDGYCLQCGRRRRAAPGEHEEQEVSADFAAVSDRGRHHSHNEDRVQIAIDSGRYVVVVCDGVSSSINAADAAQAACTRIAEGLLADGNVEAAIREAAEAVAQVGDGSPADRSPSTTAAAVVIENHEARIGWVGDTRVYWISENGSRQLTTDHSWLNDVVSSGELRYEEASNSPQAHAITRWLGADAGPDVPPELTTFRIAGPGWMLVCTDGLWNYAPDLEQLAKLVLNGDPEAPALERARHLVSFANDAGGRDNITAALLRFTGNAHA